LQVRPIDLQVVLFAVYHSLYPALTSRTRGVLVLDEGHVIARARRGQGTRGREGGREGGAGVEDGRVRLELPVVMAFVRHTLTAAVAAAAVYKAPLCY